MRQLWTETVEERVVMLKRQYGASVRQAGHPPSISDAASRNPQQTTDKLFLNGFHAGFFLAAFLSALAAQFGCQRTVSDPPAARQVESGNTGLPETVPVDRTGEDPTGDEAAPSLAELLIDPGDREIVAAAPEKRPESTRKITKSETSTTGGQQARSPISDSRIQPAATRDTSISNPRSPPGKPPAVASSLGNNDELGLRTLRGRYVTLVTDLPSSAAVNELPLVFDRAVPQWARYFRVSPSDVEKFAMTGYVIRSKERFLANGLLPDDLPPFLHGYQRGESLWIYEQPSDYYLRHLLLHEGTHGFMKLLLGGAGPPWFMEGVADFLATHTWDGGILQLGQMPKSRDEVPYWGRIKVIKDSFADGKALMIQEVMRLDSREFLKVDPYAWSWAAAAFLDGHPSFRSRFRKLPKEVTDSTVRFTRNFEHQLLNDLRELDEEWQLFVSNIEYGYDFERAAVQRNPGRPLPVAGATVVIKSDHGWQSTGYQLKAGRSYRIRSSGRYQIQQKPELWRCEPGGITLRYYKGEPLGILLGNVRFDQARPGLANLVRPLVIGRRRVIQPEDDGTLYLRINDSPAELADNDGELNVRIELR